VNNKSFVNNNWKDNIYDVDEIWYNYELSKIHMYAEDTFTPLLMKDCNVEFNEPVIATQV